MDHFGVLAVAPDQGWMLAVWGCQRALKCPSLRLKSEAAKEDANAVSHLATECLTSHGALLAEESISWAILVNSFTPSLGNSFEMKIQAGNAGTFPLSRPQERRCAVPSVRRVNRGECSGRRKALLTHLGYSKALLADVRAELRSVFRPLFIKCADGQLPAEHIPLWLPCNPCPRPERQILSSISQTWRQRLGEVSK